MTLRQLVEQAADLLADRGIENPKLEAEVLAAHCLVKDRSFVLAHGSDELEVDGFDQTVARRATGVPLAYIVGWREFYGRRFRVTPDVLIPRHETEVLVETVLEMEPRQTVLDVGTGSGCIAVTIRLESPTSEVTAVDVSAAALGVAQENAQALGAEVELIESDLFSAVQGRRFDVIVSNPPYVAETDVLPKEVKEYEPHLALYADDGGTAIYRSLALRAGGHLSADGQLIVELGDGQAATVAAVFKRERWRELEFVEDLDGNKRVAVMKRPH